MKIAMGCRHRALYALLTLLLVTECAVLQQLQSQRICLCQLQGCIEPQHARRETRRERQHTESSGRPSVSRKSIMSPSAAPNLKPGLKRMRGAARGRFGLRPPTKDVSSLKLPASHEAITWCHLPTIATCIMSHLDVSTPGAHIEGLTAEDVRTL